MATKEARAGAAGAVRIDGGAVEELRGRVRGRIILPGDAPYDERRRLFILALSA